MQAGRDVRYQAWVHDEKTMVDVIEINFQERSVGYYDFSGLNDAEAFELMRDGTPNADCTFEECHLRQFTGLRDKNGKMIFEGDIIPNPHIGNLKVHYDPGFACYAVTNERKSIDLMSYMYEYGLRLEVIGNIYETPDLLSAT